MVANSQGIAASTSERGGITFGEPGILAVKQAAASGVFLGAGSVDMGEDGTAVFDIESDNMSVFGGDYSIGDSCLGFGSMAAYFVNIDGVRKQNDIGGGTTGVDKGLKRFGTGADTNIVTAGKAGATNFNTAVG